MNTEAVKEFQDILSSGKFFSDSAETEKFSIANPVIKNGKQPYAVIRPQNQKELEDIVRASNRFDINLAVSSSTGPHTKGGFSCEYDNCMIDLSHWDRIQWVNRRNRVCQIQPGVTYGQLTEALSSHGMTVSMPLAPRTGKSVLASVMDREPCTWPNKQWDISDPVASTEFLFGSGDLFRTGAAGGPGTLSEQRAAGGAQKGPLGPSQADFHRVVQGAQGTMGIVTWISIRTELKPSIEAPFLLGSNDLSRLSSYVYAVQRPLLGEHSFILNRTALSLLMTHENTDDFSTVLAGLPEYICLQNIAGFDRFPEERIAYQKNDVRQIALLNDIKLENTIGQVSAEALLSAATSPCGDIDFRYGKKGSCLSVFFLTTLDRCEELIRNIRTLSGKENVSQDDIGIYIQPIVQNHACHMEIMVPFEPDDEKVVSRIKKYERKMVEMLISENVFFSRPYGAAGDRVFKKNPSTSPCPAVYPYENAAIQMAGIRAFR